MFEMILQAVISGLAVGSAYALVALGFSITFTTTKTLNFSHGEFVSAGAFVGMSVLFLAVGKPIDAITFANEQPSLIAHVGGLLASAAVMGGLGWLLYRLGVRPFVAKPGMAWVMSTLGFGILLQSVGMAVWGPKSVAVPSPVGDQVIRIFSIGIRPQEILMLTVSIGLMIAFDWIMRRTMVGKAMRAVAASPATAKLMGINAERIMVGAFLASCALAGISGFLLAPVIQASLFMGLAVGLKGFSSAMIGGLNNSRGCVIGGFMLGVLESLVNLWRAEWREVAIFALVIIVLAVRPSGLFGKQVVEKV